MRFSSEMECKGCGFKTKVYFKKPDRFSITTGKFICSGCESELQFFMKADSKKGHVKIQVECREPSTILVEIMKEEQEAKGNT